MREIGDSGAVVESAAPGRGAAARAPSSRAGAALLACLASMACDGGASHSVVFTPATNQPPVADAGPDRELTCTGPVTSVQLDGGASYDPDGDVLEFEWSTECASGTFDDPFVPTPVLSVPTPGCALQCRAFLTVRDGVDEATDEVWIRVLPPNQPPVCDAGGDRNVACAGPVTSLQLDASASYDPEGAPLAFAWTTDCPGGQFDDPTSVMPILSVATPTCATECRVYLAVDDGVDVSTCDALLRIANTGDSRGIERALDSDGDARALAAERASAPTRSRGPRTPGRAPAFPGTPGPGDAGGDRDAYAESAAPSPDGAIDAALPGRRLSALTLRYAGRDRPRARASGTARVLARSVDADAVVYFDAVVRRGEEFELDAASVGEAVLRAKIELVVSSVDGARPRRSRVAATWVHGLEQGSRVAGLLVTSVRQR